ncbi:TetR/AcrR family transcriptional regulator [Paracoccus laeviglucosivorans]|uniref:Transcriptional regulator, TetR family n=1 Tax=Paracoccus laeviglucosivorans TaxID=1197861 RepID=A0A521CGB5_9RHOB|nr:TetR/AcrR family transcriptional regulator [Paracoccus laeviglucosivorans]SMO58483.1 transcriptional regulator, TetR family [Paracoccus laeviglucosivorans]
MARSSYHHGNLRQALVEATVQLIEEKGPQAFTLAEAARQAGVSAAAPYRHFAGRDELLEEVARQGFEEFADRLEAAFADGRPTALTAFLHMGKAYLAFAAERRGSYIAMFESGISITGNSGLTQAADRARGVLVRGAEELFRNATGGQRPPAWMVADHIWAMSHGVVELFSRGKPGGRSPISPEDMLESGALIYLRGLGVISA